MSSNIEPEKFPLSSDGESSQLATRMRRLIPYFLGGFGVALMVLGVAINYIQSNQSTTTSGKILSEMATESGTINRQTIKVEAAGAVVRPGVYDIPYDSRVKDVLITAGGLADTTMVTSLSLSIS